MRELLFFTALLSGVASACSRSGATPQAAAKAPGCKLVSHGFGPAGTVPVRAETVVSGLEVPWGLAFLPGGDVLVTERPGRLRLIRGRRLLPRPVATFEVDATSEGGLMGLAAHPDFARNRWLYVFYTARAGARSVNRVERFRLSDDGLSVRLDKRLIDGIEAAPYHDGGRLRFGPDGNLWVGTGDAGNPRLSQVPRSPNGKLLRVTDEGAIPPDNPLPGSPVYALGLRNVQAFDWLSPTLLAIADHGPSGELGRTGHDEINVGGPKANYGWPTIYGCEARDGLVSPSLTWTGAVPPGGASFYTGTRIPKWRGSLIVGVLGGKHLHRVMFDPARPGRVVGHEVYFRGDPPGGLGRLRDVEMSPDGELWVTTSNCDGRGNCLAAGDRIVRIVRRSPRPSTPGTQTHVSSPATMGAAR